MMKRQPGFKKARLLISPAKNSICTTLAYDAYKLHLEILLDEFDLATTQFERVEKEIKEVLNKITYAELTRSSIH